MCLFSTRTPTVSAADAHGFQAVGGITTLHFPAHVSQNAGSCRAHGVTDGNAGPVDVDPLVFLLYQSRGSGADQDLKMLKATKPMM